MPREISIFSTQVSFIYFSSSFLLTKWKFYKQKPILQSLFSLWVMGIARSSQTWFYQAFGLDVINIQKYFISHFLFFNRHIPKIGLNWHISIFVDCKLPQRSVGYINAPSPHDLPRPSFSHQVKYWMKSMWYFASKCRFF